MNLKRYMRKARKVRPVVAMATKTVTQGFAVFGALALITVMVGPDFSRDDHIADAQAAGIETAVFENAPTPHQRALTEYLSRRYRVAGGAVGQWVQEAYAAGRQSNMDPLLILSVVAIESRFNPIAESAYGAKGLMQVVPRFHLEKLAVHGGDSALLEPAVNIQVGVQILKSYIRRTGSLESGLQLYAGAADDPESRYAQRVFAEQERLRRVLSGPTLRAEI